MLLEGNQLAKESVYDNSLILHRQIFNEKYQTMTLQFPKPKSTCMVM